MAYSLPIPAQLLSPWFNTGEKQALSALSSYIQDESITPLRIYLEDLIAAVSVGGIADGDKGDITVSGTGTIWTIDAGAVTLAKMANMATGSLIYRKTAGTGAPEVQTLATLKTDLGLTGTNSGDQTITLTGDVTGSGTGSFAATIANASVTFAKMQDSSAASKLLGRGSASGAGDFEEITLGTNLSMSGTTLNATGGGSTAWGAITGTLSSQTDLQSALDAKAPLLDPVFTSRLTINDTTDTTSTLHVGGSHIAGSTTIHSVNVHETCHSGVTGSFTGFRSYMSTPAAAFTLTNLYNFAAFNGTKGAGSTITNQWGYWVEDLTNATNNYGYHTGQNAGATSWAFYAPNGAKSYLNGPLLLGSATDDGVNKLQVTGSATISSTIAASNLSGTNTGDQTITLTGNVTGSGTGSFATTIAAGAVTLAMQANMATSSVVYRKTAGAGAPEVQTLATLKTDLGLTGTNSGDQTITLTGNVTGTGTGSFATTIANNAVTLGMMAQMATASFLGRNTAATGNVEVLSTATAKTMLNLTGTNSGDQTSIVGITGTKAQFNTAVTDGDIVYLDSADTITGAKTMTGLNAVLCSSSGLTIRNPGNTFKYTITAAAIAADRVLTLPLTAGTLALTSDITGTNSGTNTGDQTSIVGISGTKAQFDTAASDGNFSWVGNALTADHTGGNWKVFYTNGTGVITELGVGASGTFLGGNGISAAPSWQTPAGSGDMVLANAQTNSGAKTFLDTTFLLRNVANTFNGSFVNTNTADRVYTLKDSNGTIAFTSDITGTNSGTNTGDQTSIVGISGTKAQFDTAVSDGNFSYVGNTLAADHTGGNWKVFYTNGSGVITELTTGAAGTFLGGNGVTAAPSWQTPAGSGDMVLASAQTNSGVKTFLDTTMKLRNVANTFDGYFVNTNTADRVYTLKDASGTIAFTSDITGTNSGTNTGDQTSIVGISGTIAQFNTACSDADFATGGGTATGTNTGDQTITLTGNVTGTGTGSFATTIAAAAVTRAMLSNGTALSVIGRSVNSAGVTADIAATAATDAVLRESGSTIGWGTIATGGIANAAVTLAKMADVATGTVFYRKTAATGVPEVQTLATLKTDLGLTGTNSGDQTSIVGFSNTIAQFNTACSDADFAPIASPTFTGTPAAPTAAVGTTTTQVATTAFVRTPSIQSITSAATITPTFADDQVIITALAVAITSFANPTGTAQDGRKLIVRIKDNGTARSITGWGTQYRAIGTSLPSTTVLGKTMYLGFIYNSADTKWDLIATAQEA